MRGSAEHLIVFTKEFNKFNITGARVQDSIYHMTLKSHFINRICTKYVTISPLENVPRFYRRQRIMLRRHLHI